MKKIYKLHRRLSVIIAIPVLLWASSGFMHPLMTNLRPAIATQGWPAVAVDSGRLKVPLAEALRRHHLDSFANVRLIHIDTNWFYQVQPAVHRMGAAMGLSASPAIQPTVPVYLSCTNGNVLAAGDWLYAQYLARHFLEGKEPAAATPPRTRKMPMEDMPDCCGAAAEFVLNPVKGAKVANVSLLTNYDNEYKSINRLLPVYRVSFARADGIRIYVETTQDRFSFAMDNRRAVFDEIFRLFHTWGWLDALGKARIAVEFGVALLAFFTALLGIWLFFTTTAAKGKTNPIVRSRRYHRYTAIVAALFTLFWSFSGSYHAFTKLIGSGEVAGIPAVNFASIGFDEGRIRAAAGRPITGISLSQIDGELYWRVSLLSGPGRREKHDSIQADWHKDLMKDGKAELPPVLYISNSDYRVLPDGDRRYAVSLARRFSGQAADAATTQGTATPPDTESPAISVTPITTFNDEYNFTDKRLPVWRVSYPDAGNPRPGHPRWYVETSSGQLAAFVNDAVYREGYSFSVFHKHHFMDWGGKTVRDGSTMFWAIAQVLMVTMGLILYFRSRRRNKLPLT